MAGGLGEIGGFVNSQVGAVTSAPNAIADAVAEGAGAAAGAAIGTAGAVVGAAQGMTTMTEGTAQMAADIASQTIADITSFAMETLSNNLVAIITPPSLGDIMTHAGQVMGEYVKKNGPEEVGNLLIDQEKIAEIKEKLSITNALGSVVGSINDVVSKITEKINYYCGIVGNKVNEMKSHMAEGKDWLLDQMNKYTNEIKDCIEDFINDQTSALLEVKKRAIEGLGEAIGIGLGKAVVCIMKKTAKDVQDAIREKIQNVIVKAKALIGKALLNLWAKIGG